MPLNNQLVNEEIEKYLQTNKNRNKMVQNLWDIAKATLRGEFIELQAYLKK